MKVRLFDGSQHSVDSNEHAFNIVTKMALSEAYLKAKPVLLEPIMKAIIFTPQEYFSKVVAEIHTSRGKILNTNLKTITEIKISIPLDTLNTLQPKLLSLTQGRGRIEIEGKDKYDVVPGHIAQKIINKFQETRYKK